MTYQEKLEQAKDYLINEMLPGYPSASFVELERNLKDKGFFEPVDANDPHCTSSIQPNGRPHLVMWISHNKLLIDAFLDLEKQHKIVTRPASHITYAADGQLLRFPMPTKPVLKDGYRAKEDEMYWIPVVVNTPEYDKVVGWKQRDAEMRLKYFKKLNREKGLHICGTGIGWYTDKSWNSNKDRSDWMSFHDRCKPPESSEVEVCKKWIEERAKKTKKGTINMDLGSSYHLKHVVENDREINRKDRWYVSNGAFIKAAIDLGYKYKISEAGPNAYFDMELKEKEPKEESTYF